MRSLVTYRPTAVNVDRWFDSLFQDWVRPTTAVSAPSVDIHETEDAYHLEAELPGLTEKDFTVDVEQNLLTISSEKDSSAKETTTEGERNGYVIRERQRGAFKRSFVLPRHVDTDQISAQFKDGLLTLVVPKAAQAQRKQITVKA